MARVVVVGAVNVDLVVAAARLPGPGETVVGGRLRRHGGGKGANAAVAAARAGAEVALVAAVGDDDWGREALAELRAEGIDVGAVASVPAGTGVALIVVDPAGANQIAVAPGANEAVDPRAAAMAVAGGRPDVVLVSSEVPAAVVAAAVDAATGAGVPCVLNPAPVLAEVAGLLGRGPLLTPNQVECAQLARLAGVAEGDVAAMARGLSARSGAGVVVTLGAEGAVLASPDGDVRPVPSGHAEVVDTTGAGDTFNGVLAAWLAGGADLPGAVAAAMAAAAVSVGVAGARAGMPRRDAIEAAVGP